MTDIEKAIETLKKRSKFVADINLDAKMAYKLATQALKKQIDTDGITAERHKQICDAERENRCVVLPCKIDDVVYCIEKGFTYILKQIVNQFYINKKGTFVEVYNVNERGYINHHQYPVSEFGKTILFSYEEAEQALKEMEGE